MAQINVFYRKIKHIHALSLAVAVVSANVLTAPAAWSQTVRLLGHLVMGETRIAGEKIGEFSALVAAPDGHGLIAISDRGILPG